MTFVAGQILTADDLNAWLPVTVQKAGDTARTSTATRTADPDLVLALLANMTYDVDGMLIVTSAANNAGDFSQEWQFPSGATVTNGGAGLNNGLASGSSGDWEGLANGPDSTSPTGAIPYGASTSPTGILVKVRIVVGSTAGNLTLSWAQVASNANATTLKAGSWLTARRVA